MPRPESETAAEIAADRHYLTTLHPDQLEYYELCDRTRAYSDDPANGPKLSRVYDERARRRQGGHPNGPIEAAPPFKTVPPARSLSEAAGVLYPA